MDVEPRTHDVAVARLPVSHLRVEIDVRIDLQTLQRLAVVYRLVAPTLFLFLPIVQGECRLGEVDVCVVGISVNARVDSRAFLVFVHIGPPVFPPRRPRTDRVHAGDRLAGQDLTYSV